MAENPHHRRARLVVLTDSGRAALDQVESARRRWASRIARDVPAGDLEAAADTLRELRTRLDRS
jgi:DNA-binding MarR family transcriptional regulator